MLQVDVQLGLICIGDVEASFVQALVAFNDVTLPDDEALQQDNTAILAMRVKRSVDCLLSGTAETSVTHRGKAAERWSGFGGQLDAARPRGRSALGGLGPHGRTRRVECALARPSWCAPCGRSRTISDAAVPFRGVCPTDCHIWFGMDTNETTRQHRRANAWRDNDGGGRRLSVQFCTVLTSPDVLAALIVDSLWEDMSEAGQRIFFQLSSHDWLNVGRHEWRRPPHLLLAAGPMVDSMWESWGRDGQIKNVRDMCGFCPTVGRNATGLVKILITAKMWHSCGKTEFYRFCTCCFDNQLHKCTCLSVLLRPCTFPLLHRHRACDLRAGGGFLRSWPVGVVHKLS